MSLLLYCQQMFEMGDAEMNDQEVQAEVEALNIEFKTYIDKLRANWLSQNRLRSNTVYEVMNTREREEVQARIHQWELYVTPFAEAWWKKRGYEVFWPEDSSKPMRVQKLEAA